MSPSAAAADLASPRDDHEPGRTYDVRGFLADLASLLRAGPRLLAIYRDDRIDPALRERIMVAVSRANSCRECTRVHEAWAVRAGVSADELTRLGAGELAYTPADQRPAVVFATALAEASFGPLPIEVRALVDDHVDTERQRDVEAIARLMTFANLSVNGTHAAIRGRSRLV